MQGVTQHFKKRSFKLRLKDTGYLLKHSFTLFGKEKDLKKPTINMVIYSLIMTCFIFFFILSLIIGKLIGLGIFLLVISLIILTPIKFFYYAKQKSIQSWIAYHALKGVDVDVKQAKKNIKSERGKIRGIAGISFLMSLLGTKSESKGIKGIIKNIIISIFKEVWDLLKHYMVPAIVIEKKKLRQCIVNIKSLKTNVPATLVGVFGIDFAGNIVSSFVLMIGLPAIVIGILISYFLSSLIPIFIILFIMVVISNIVNKFVQSVKVIYFTILYTSINRPKDISKDISQDITNYLLMKEGDFEIKKPQNNASNKYNSELESWVKNYLSSGYSKEKIKKILLENGHKIENIENCFNNLKNQQTN